MLLRRTSLRQLEDWILEFHWMLPTSRRRLSELDGGVRGYGDNGSSPVCFHCSGSRDKRRIARQNPAIETSQDGDSAVVLGAARYCYYLVSHRRCSCRRGGRVVPCAS